MACTSLQLLLNMEETQNTHYKRCTGGLDYMPQKNPLLVFDIDDTERSETTRTGHVTCRVTTCYVATCILTRQELKKQFESDEKHFFSGLHRHIRRL